MNLNSAVELNRREQRTRRLNDFGSNRSSPKPHPAGEACWQEKSDAIPSASACSASSCSSQLLLLGSSVSHDFVAAPRVERRKSRPKSQRRSHGTPPQLCLVVMNINTMTFVAPNLACGKARGGRIPHSGSVTDEQRSHRPNSAQPSGRQSFFGQTSLLAPYRSTAGYARRARLVWPKNPLPRTSSYLCS